MDGMDDMDDVESIIARLGFIDFELVFNGSNSHERCGFIDAAGEVIEWPNMHPHPRYNFRIKSDWVRQVLDDPSVGLWALWHTHPVYATRTPTAKDLESIPAGLLGVVLHVPTRMLTAYVHGRVIGMTRYRRR